MAGHRHGTYRPLWVLYLTSPHLTSGFGSRAILAYHQALSFHAGQPHRSHPGLHLDVGHGLPSLRCLSCTDRALRYQFADGGKDGPSSCPFENTRGPNPEGEKQGNLDVPPAKTRTTLSTRSESRLTSRPASGGAATAVHRFLKRKRTVTTQHVAFWMGT